MFFSKKKTYSQYDVRTSAPARMEFSDALADYEKLHDVKLDWPKLWDAFFDGKIDSDLIGIEKYL